MSRYTDILATGNAAAIADARRQVQISAACRSFCECPEPELHHLGLMCGHCLREVAGAREMLEAQRAAYAAQFAATSRELDDPGVGEGERHG